MFTAKRVVPGEKMSRGGKAAKEREWRASRDEGTASDVVPSLAYSRSSSVFEWRDGRAA